MALTYDPIATTTLGSAASSLNFTSISSNYTDLIVVISTKSTTDSYVKTTYNNDTNSNYSWTKLIGTGSSALSNRGSNQTSWQSFYTYNGESFNTVIFNLMNYSNTTTYKTVLMRENSAGFEVDAFVNLWRSTAAITSIKFEKVSGNFDSGTTATLYGVKASA